jgi:hypothetical protein
MVSALKPPRFKLPLIPISSEYDRLLVDDTAPDLGGGPMDPYATAGEVLADGTVADEGLAEKLMSRLFTTRGLILCTVLVVAALCVGVLRGAYESDEASLAARATEGMFQLTGVSARDAGVVHARRGGHGHATIKEAHLIPLEERLAPRSAAMPHEDDGRAQRLVEEVTTSRGKTSAIRAALDPRSEAARLVAAAEVYARKNVDPVFDPRVPQTQPEKPRKTARLGRVDMPRAFPARMVGTPAISWDAEDEIDGDEDIPAVEPARRNRGKGRRTDRRGASKGNVRRAGLGERNDLPVMRATQMEHGATHQKALAQLEASIRSSVKEAHARRFRAEKDEDEDE